MRREGQSRGLNGILGYSFRPQVGLPLRNSFGSSFDGAHHGSLAVLVVLVI